MNSKGMKVVKLLDQASEDGPRDNLREQVGDHHDAGEVFDGDDTTADEIAKELGGTQDVYSVVLQAKATHVAAIASDSSCNSIFANILSYYCYY